MKSTLIRDICRQPGQTAASDISKRDLRAELLAAEQEVREKKRKAEGKPSAVLAVEDKPDLATEDDDASKRRKLLQEALELDKDDDEGDANGDHEGKDGNVENGEKSGDEDRYVVFRQFVFSVVLNATFLLHSDEDSNEEDDTAELLRELEKIKRERAEEKERQEREQNANAQKERESEIATANPLLNLAAALGQSPGVNTTVPGTFAVKRRWDDGAFCICDTVSYAQYYSTSRPNLQKPSYQLG